MPHRGHHEGWGVSSSLCISAATPQTALTTDDREALLDSCAEALADAIWQELMTTDPLEGL